MKIAPVYAALERRGVDQRLVHTRRLATARTFYCYDP
jgi:hypothetical protein